MNRKPGAFLAHKNRISLQTLLIWMSFFFLEGFACLFLAGGERWTLFFGALWATILTGLVRLLPRRAGRIAYAVFYYLFYIYTVAQTGYYILFGEMMWLSDFRYASEGAGYLDILLRYPALWWGCLAALAVLGDVVIRFFPAAMGRSGKTAAACLVLAAAMGAYVLPEYTFRQDGSIRYALSDYGRMQSAEAAYKNLFNTHRLYQICGIYQTAVKDVYAHLIYPATPAYAKAQEEAKQEVDAYFAEKPEPQENEMTGLLAGKNVILVLMESMDDWMIGEHTPTIRRLMDEGINFSNFYTPAYGGIRTFNTEFCINTGSFLSSQGGYAFDYVTNHFNQSLPSLLTQAGYNALTFHYNTPSFYSRGVFSEAMGYERYVSYQEFERDKEALYDDQLLFDNEDLNSLFFRDGLKLNFVITRSAHLSYRANEVLSHWALKKYPDYRTLTDNEETNCALVKARLVDDLFARMLTELEEHGQLENTVIIGVTDHYTYGYKNEQELLELSGVEEKLLLEKTPCFIWSPDLEHMQVEKLLSTVDFLPTVLNLLNIKSAYSYMGSDAFDPRYDGLVPFSGGSWIWGYTAYNAQNKQYFSTCGEEINGDEELRGEIQRRVQRFIHINNQILETDYYSQ